MTEDEIDGFLESKLNLQLASIDGKGDPNIHLFGLDTTKSYEKSLS